jgi:hypothetical protein
MEYQYRHPGAQLLAELPWVGHGRAPVPSGQRRRRLYDHPVSPSAPAAARR